MNELLINIGIYVTYGLLVIAVLASVAFPIIQFVQDIRKAKGTLIGLGVLLFVLLISWAFASSAPFEEHNVGSAVSKLIGGGIIATFMLIVIGLAAAIYTEVSKLIK